MYHARMEDQHGMQHRLMMLYDGQEALNLHGMKCYTIAQSMALEKHVKPGTLYCCLL